MGRRLLAGLVIFLCESGAAPPDKPEVNNQAEGERAIAATPLHDNAPQAANEADSGQQTNNTDDQELQGDVNATTRVEEGVDPAWAGVGVEAVGVFLAFVSIVLVVIALRQTNKSLRLGMKDRATATRRAVAQSKETEDAIAQATRSADAAQALAEQTASAVEIAATANEIAGRAHEQRLSPYIMVAASDLRIDSNLEPSARIVLRNFGQSPAFNVRTWFHMWLEEFPLGNPLPMPQDGEVLMGTNNIGPGGTSELNITNGRPILGHLQSEILAGRAAIYVYGESIYSDIFRNRFRLQFNLFCTGEENINSRRFSPYMEGNHVSRIIEGSE